MILEMKVCSYLNACKFETLAWLAKAGICVKGQLQGLGCSKQQGTPLKRWRPINLEREELRWR
jgi:hypothetical protein